MHPHSHVSVLLAGKLALVYVASDTKASHGPQNKVQQLRVLQAAGLRFWVDHEGYLVHQPHPPSNSFAEFSSGQPLHKHSTSDSGAEPHNNSLQSIMTAW